MQKKILEEITRNSINIGKMLWKNKKKLEEKQVDKNQINVMMFGGRRCGKTSILAAMQSCFESKLGSGNLSIGPEDTDTTFAIERKTMELNSYFLGGCKREFVPDSDPTSELNEYKFFIKLKNKKDSQIVVNFVDYPGEWLDDKSKFNILSAYMKKSNVIIVAIDTPYLMEELPSKEDTAVGRFNDQRNYSITIGNMIKKNFEPEGMKMLLFVPVKCEKYYHAKKMEEVSEKIKSAYKEVFNYIKGNEKHFQVAITPILTMGSAEFSRFKRDEEGEIIMDRHYGIPIEARYYFPNVDSPKRESKFCEQPMLYVLLYLLEVVKAAEDPLNKKKAAIFKDVIGKLFGNIPTIDDFVNEQNAIKKEIKVSGDGYQILNNPLKF